MGGSPLDPYRLYVYTVCVCLCTGPLLFVLLCSLIIGLESDSLPYYPIKIRKEICEYVKDVTYTL